MITQASEHAETPCLQGLRVLVVEDEFFIGDDLRRCLVDAGAEVIGPEPTVAKAEAAIARGGIDCAVLDLNLHGESGAAVADRLTALGIPFAIATGYGAVAVPERFGGVPRCEKPFEPAALLKVITRWSKAPPE